LIERLYRLLTRRWTRRAGVLRTILEALGSLLTDAEDHLRIAFLQLSVLTAEGAWLEYWGDRFGLAKFYNEPDNAFRGRVLDHLRNPRGTKSSILSAVRPFVYGEPTVTEVVGGTVAGVTSYTAADYSYDGSAHTMIVQFRPFAFSASCTVGISAVIDPATIPVGVDITEYKGVITEGGAVPPNVRVIFDEVNRVKTSGTKVVLKSV
jgi:hypothetical protein